MHVRCPHCRNPIELVDDDPLSEVVCPSCGSSFSLIADETVSYPQGTNERIGHFELLERVGIGAFGTVWKARDTELDRTVAIKIPRQGQIDSKERETFLREARAAAQLQHPGIVGVHEVGRENDTVYIVSDFVQGVPLSSRLTAGPVTVREAAEMCAKIADALQHAHEAGVIHRDIKPSNIMLDDDGEPHVMDFGLAKRDAGEITITVDGNILGTPAYMSPEQASGSAHAADARSDVYSVGVILYELVTGEKPFRGDRRMLLHQVINDDPLRPRSLNSSIPRDMEAICLRCLEKEPHRRYTSAAELAADLRRFVDGRATHARPVGTLRTAWRWYRRRAVTLAGMAALTTIAFEGLSCASMAGNTALHDYKAEGIASVGTALSVLLVFSSILVPIVGVSFAAMSLTGDRVGFFGTSIILGASSVVFFSLFIFSLRDLNITVMSLFFLLWTLMCFVMQLHALAVTRKPSRTRPVWRRAHG